MFVNNETKRSYKKVINGCSWILDIEAKEGMSFFCLVRLGGKIAASGYYRIGSGVIEEITISSMRLTESVVERFSEYATAIMALQEFIVREITPEKVVIEEKF